MKLKQLLKEIPVEIRGSKEIEIRGLSNNSKLTAPGFLFFAKKGKTHQGNNFIQEAISGGAVAVVTDFFDPFIQGITQIICTNIADLEKNLSDRFYGNGSSNLLTVGITGTNGKTTTSYLMKHLLDAKKMDAGLIGTIEWIIKQVVLPSTHTTPDLLTIRKLLKEMESASCKSVVMEVSSHGLDQGRVDGIDFDIAIFTNLTQDHLDYHETMQQYMEAKAKLFSSLYVKKESKKTYPKTAIINIDSPYAVEMIQASSCRVLTYGIDQKADLQAEEIDLSSEETSCTIRYLNQSCFFKTHLIGRYNLLNCLGVIGAGLALGFDLQEIVEILSSFKTVRGRLEKVETASRKQIFVDYAHTEDALKNVLLTLKEVAKGKLICVFGCGGNRDHTKRQKMGRVVELYADIGVITTDNPRGESPEKIIEEILEGVENKEKMWIEVNRKEAIGRAIATMTNEDIVVIAGKGHETSQIFSNHAIHFDDRITAKEYAH